jgi:hypothetical protein
LTADASSVSDLAAVFHSVLFAYQKVLRDAAGEIPAQTITSLTVPVVKEILERTSPGLLNTEKVDDALRKLSEWVNNTGTVQRFRIERSDDRYISIVEGCSFAQSVHSMLKPTDVTCPWAIVTMAVLQSVGKRKVKVNPSEFSSSGSRTTIELI